MADTFAIPDAVRKAAARGLELRKHHGRGGTEVGLTTARTLAAGGTVGAAKIRHIARYWDRHAGDNLHDKESNGYIAWMLWGGDPGRSWSKAAVAKLDRRESLATVVAVRNALAELGGF